MWDFCFFCYTRSYIGIMLIKKCNVSGLPGRVKLAFQFVPRQCGCSRSQNRRNCVVRDTCSEACQTVQTELLPTDIVKVHALQKSFSSSKTFLGLVPIEDAALTSV